MSVVPVKDDRTPRPTVDFDHHRAPDDKHPWVAAKELRETCPVAWSEHYGGFWVVSKYEDVRRVLRDYADFTSRRLGDPELSAFQIPAMKFSLGMPSEFDPPESQKYRRRLNRILSPAAVAELEPRIRYWATVYLDEVIESGACDLAEAIATPLPATVALEWLGVPTDVLARALSSYHDYLGYAPGTPESQAGYEGIVWLNRRIESELEARVDQPRDDLLSWLLHSEQDGERLPFHDVVEMTCLLVAAGIDTTTNAIAAALVHLGRNPEQRARLREEPELWATAVDELLRRYPPVTSHARTVARDVELGGCLLREGEKVLALESSACHDESVFPDAETVRLDRHPNHHLAFGIGSHRCVGMHLARLQMQVALEEVITRMPNYVIDEDRLTPYPDQANVAGWQRIPVTFTPGARVLRELA